MSTRAFRDVREFKSWNDAMVEKYDVEQFHNHPSPLIRYVEGKRVRRILALLAARPGDRVLEIGCGAGNILAQVPSARRFGIDLAESLLAKAARRLVKRGTLVQGDAEHLPFRDRAWERVYCSEVLEHIPALFRRFHHHEQLLTDFRLAGKFAEGRRPQRNVERRVGGFG